MGLRVFRISGSSVVVFMFVLIGAAIVGSGTAIAPVIRSNQGSFMKEEWVVAVILGAHKMRKSSEKMSQASAKRIDEVEAAQGNLLLSSRFAVNGRVVLTPDLNQRLRLGSISSGIPRSEQNYP